MVDILRNEVSTKPIRIETGLGIIGLLKRQKKSRTAHTIALHNRPLSSTKTPNKLTKTSDGFDLRTVAGSGNRFTGLSPHNPGENDWFRVLTPFQSTADCGTSPPFGVSRTGQVPQYVRYLRAVGEGGSLYFVEASDR